MPEPTREELLAACQVLVDESIGDFVYAIREHVLGDESYQGEPWLHPRVRAFAAAAKTIQRFVDARAGLPVTNGGAE